MAHRNEVFSQTIKHKGYFSFKDLYSFFYDLLQDDGYSDDGDEGYGIKEKEYSEKIGSSGKDIEVEWEAKKKVTDYFKNVLKIRWKVSDLKDVEVERDGKKVSTNKGGLKLKITAYMEKDYEDRWEKQPLWKMMRGIYERYIIRTTIEQYERKLRDNVRDMFEEIKSFLQLSS